MVTYFNHSSMGLRKDAKIAVVGGGVAGLVAAHTLMQRGCHRITLFEREARVGGKVHSVFEDGYIFELGAVWVGRSYGTVESLAKEYKVPLVSDRVEHVIRDRDGHLHRMADFFSKGRSSIKLVKCMVNWQLVCRKFADIGKVDGFFRPLHPDTLLPFRDFATKYGIEPLAGVFRPFWLGCGYQYFDKIPAIYVLKLLFYFDYSIPRFLKQILPVERWHPNHLRQIVGGYQKLWEKVAENIPDLRLCQEVESIDRLKVEGREIITIKANGQVNEFDAVILATPIQSLRRCMRLTPDEEGLFNEIKSYRYVTRLCHVEGMEQYGGKMLLLDEHGEVASVGHLTSLICRKERPHLIFTSQIVGAHQSQEDLQEILRMDISNLGGKLIDIRRSVMWDYLPHVESRALASGFYQKIAELQGRGNCWMIGGLMNFESVEGTAAFAKKLVESFVLN